MVIQTHHIDGTAADVVSVVFWKDEEILVVAGHSFSYNAILHLSIQRVIVLKIGEVYVFTEQLAKKVRQLMG